MAQPFIGKICLFALNGSYTHTSLAIRCLREPLEKAGFAVTLLERNLRDRDAHLLSDLAESGADAVSFSVYIWNLPRMLQLAENLKAVRPGIKIIFGGPEVSYGTERFEGLPFLDAVICGEGEETLPRVCADLLAGKPTPKILPGVPPGNRMSDGGILYRPEEFSVRSIPAGALLYYESARGCPYRCAYCLSSVSEGLRAKSPEQVARDMLAFENPALGCRVVKFVDRTFNWNPARANEIWRLLLSEKYTRRYHFELCASLLNEESFQVLSQFPPGKLQLECGLQSTNPETLQAVSRHIDPAAVLAAVKRVHDMGNIHIHLDLIAGLPFEDYTRFARSFDEAYPVCDLLQLGFLKLLHGTELRRRSAEYGISCTSAPPYTVLKTNWMSYDDLNRLSRMAETLERFRESGKFNRSIVFLLARTPSPFRFYEGLTDFIRRTDGRALQKLSQPEAYRLLYGFGCTLLQNPSDRTAFEAVLHEDYAGAETRRMPVL